MLEYFSFVSSLHFAVLAFVLYHKNKPKLMHITALIRLLLFMCLYTGLVFLHFIAVDKELVHILRYYFPIDGMVMASLAPSLYYYVMATIDVAVPRSTKVSVLHSLPFWPFVLFNVYFATFTSSQRVDWLMRDYQYGTLHNNVLNVVLYIQILIYLIISLRQVQLKMKCNIQAETVTPDFHWLRNYLLITTIYTVVSMPFCFYIANEQTNIIIGLLAMNIQFSYLFYKITTNKYLFNSPSYGEDKPIPIECNSMVKAYKINIEAADDVIAKLIAHMDIEKPYLHESCSVQSVADNIGIPPHQLSTILNCKFKKTFPDYINEYRINAAQQILLSVKSDSVTIETIAHECGFGSKTNFNRTFKKFSNNVTPKAFIQQNKSIE